MAAQKGRELLIKMDIASVFTSIAGMKQSSFRITDGNVDVSSADSAADAGRWREMLAGAGVLAMSVSGSGVYKSAASEKALLTKKVAAETPDFQMVVPGLGEFEGPFVIGDLEYAGSFDGEVTYSMAFESAGEIAFTAE